MFTRNIFLAMIVAIPMLGYSEAAFSQNFETVTTSGGKPVRVLSSWNCRTGSYPGASGAASNGTIEIRKTTQNRCSNPAQPVEELWYTPNRGFKGEDTFSGTSGTARVDRKIIVR